MATAPAAGTGTLAKLPLPARIGAGVAFCALIAVAYWVMFYSETSSAIDKERGREAQLRSQLAEQQQAQANYFADRDELAMRQQKQKELNKVLPPDTEVASFLSALQQVSNVSGVDLKAWHPEEERTEAYFARVPMKLELSGKFHQMAKFSYEVGRLDRIINIENIELHDPKVVGDEIVLHAKLLATAFHTISRATPAGAGSAGATPGAGTTPPPQGAPR